MVFITLIAIAATAASAYAAAEQAKAQDDFNALKVNINNKAAMANYRRNLVKFGELRIAKRKQSLNVQDSVAVQYQRARSQFEGTFADNWGQSAHLFAQSIARRAGEDREQLEQNLQRELRGINETQEESRLNLTNEFKAPPPSKFGAAVLRGAIAVGASIGSELADLQEREATDRQDKARNARGGGFFDTFDTRFDPDTSTSDFFSNLKTNTVAQRDAFILGNL